MKNRATLFLASLTALLACSEDPPAATIPVCPVSGPPEAFIAATFNTALGPGLDVPYAAERLDPDAQAIAAAHWSVLCLNEAWTDADRTAILAALALPAEQVVTADTRGQNEDPRDRCSPGELDDGLACIRMECDGLPDRDVTSCATQKCQLEGFLLYEKHPRCFNCVVASAGKSADQIEASCNGFGDSRLFGGRNGVILASRLPLRNAESIPLPSSEANRVALFATVDVGGLPLEVACTHLSAAVGFIAPTYTGFPDWNAEMIAQIRLVSRRLKARAGNGPQLLLGDLNTGPARGGDGQTDAPEVWDEIRKLGFEDPAGDANPPICSRCQDSLIAPTGGSESLIDHVLTRGGRVPKPECAERSFDDRITITDFAGRPVETNRSDHYGISVRFSP
mgnify:CR=1 FL=1